MDPNKFPLLSFVLSRHHPNPNPHPSPDIEQLQCSDNPHGDLRRRMPRLNRPALLVSMTAAVADVDRIRSVLGSLGDRPDHESVDAARSRLDEIDDELSRPSEAKDRERLARERTAYRAVLQLDVMHESYERLLSDAEERLVKIYVADGGGEGEKNGGGGSNGVEMDEEAEKVVRDGRDGNGAALERVDLSGRKMRSLPEAFGWVQGIVALDLSDNRLEVLPDAITGLECLEELRLSSNMLARLPDSIGLLLNLRVLDVSGNKLRELPDSISHCRSLVELDISYNGITYLPANIGCELMNLQKLMLHLNKLRSLPASVCGMISLRHLDAHFNELHGLPHAFGKLVNLEVLDLSSNFSNLTKLPESFGELSNLREVDLSNNQIHALPDSFGLLENLVKLNLDQNPIVIPPVEVAKKDAKAVMDFMSRRIITILEEERQKRELEEKAEEQTGWLMRSTSIFSMWASGVSETVADYLGVGSKPQPLKDPDLDRLL